MDYNRIYAGRDPKQHAAKDSGTKSLISNVLFRVALAPSYRGLYYPAGLPRSPVQLIRASKYASIGQKLNLL